MSRVSCLVGLVFISTVVSAQPPAPPSPMIIDMPAVQGVAMPQMPPRDNAQPAKPGTATIRGRVLAADTGQPLRKAQVRVAGEMRENRLATTDADGKYEFKLLPAGRYNISASKGSYVGLQYGQQRPFEPGKPLEILDGQTVEKVDFALPRGGVITGRILDEFGEPLADAQVAAQRYQNMGGRRRLVPAGRPATTNDIGEFRLFAIPPGQYYLSAALRNFGMMGDTDDRSGYAPTYFPGTANMAEAQKVTIGLGQTVSDINMALMPTRTARITGTAVDLQGRPFVGVVMAMPRGDSMMMMFGPPGQIKPDGSFSINGLAPGTYMLQTQGGGPDGDSASTEVTVSGDDVDGIRLVASKPSKAAGRIIVDAAAAQALRPSALRVVVQPAVFDMPMMGGMPGPAVVNDDLTFELKTRPGRMKVALGGPPAGWTIRAVRYRGIDVSDSGIEFRANEDITDIEVELTNRVTDLSGLVTNGRGAAVKDYSVVVFAQDRDKWTANSRYLRTGRPDQDGRFKITGLPPGEYHIVAIDYVDPNEWTEPDYLERVRSKATSVTIGEGETKSVDLKINTAS